MSQSRNKYSRHDRIAQSQIMDLKDQKKTITPKVFHISKSTKNSDQVQPAPFFLAISSKAPDYGQSQILNHDALKSKIKEKRNPFDAEALLSKIVTKVDTNVNTLTKVEIKPFSKKKPLTIDATNAIKFKPYSLTPQSRQQSFRLQTPSLKPRSQSQARKNEIYYMQKLKKAFETNGVDYFSRLFREHFHQTYQGLNHKFYPQNSNDYNRCIRIPKSTEHRNKITLFFDLDETLVHCNESPNLPNDIVLDITVSKYQTVRAGINIRPHAKELLINLSPYFEIIVFTASHQCYADKVINHLDPDGTLVSHRLFRDSCTMTNNQLYTKDLKVFCDNTNRPLSQVVLIDNAAYSYAWQIENGIPILPYYDNKEDKELIDLELYLKGMVGLDDVREYNKQNLKLHLFADQRGPYKVLENLFGKQPNLY